MYLSFTDIMGALRIRQGWFELELRAEGRLVNRNSYNNWQRKQLRFSSVS